MEVQEMAEALARRWGAEPEAEDDGTFTVDVETGEGDRVLVSVYADEVPEDPARGAQVLMMRAQAGEEVDTSDGLRLLELPASSWLARLYYEADSLLLYAEAALPLEPFREDLAVLALEEVAGLAVAAAALLED